MGFLRRLLGREQAELPSTPSPVAAPDRYGAVADGVSFKELMWQLGSASEQTRGEVAILLSALGHRAAIRPLIRAYGAYGDESLLEALRAFGPKLTPVAAREVRDQSLSLTHRARLMDVLGASGDPGAVALVLPVAGEDDPKVHLAACRALAQLGDPRGVDKLADDLLRFEDELRIGALQVLQALDDPVAEAAIEEHVQGYLAAGGAVPRQVAVSLPLLVDPAADLAHLVAGRVRHSQCTLTVVTGPGIDVVVERQRGDVEEQLERCALYFTTARHTADEQLEVLRVARDRAARDPRGRVALVGRLPSPEGSYPLPHFLTMTQAADYSARIVLVGPQKPAFVLEWWHYVDDRAEVPTDLEVILTNLVLGRGDLTAEEITVYRLAGEDRREEYARAFLAHL